MAPRRPAEDGGPAEGYVSDSWTTERKPRTERPQRRPCPSPRGRERHVPRTNRHAVPAWPLSMCTPARRGCSPRPAGRRVPAVPGMHILVTARHARRHGRARRHGGQHDRHTVGARATAPHLRTACPCAGPRAAPWRVDRVSTPPDDADTTRRQQVVNTGRGEAYQTPHQGPWRRPTSLTLYTRSRIRKTDHPKPWRQPNGSVLPNPAEEPEPMVVPEGPSTRRTGRRPGEGPDQPPMVRKQARLQRKRCAGAERAEQSAKPDIHRMARPGSSRKDRRTAAHRTALSEHQRRTSAPGNPGPAGDRPRPADRKQGGRQGGTKTAG